LEELLPKDNETIHRLLDGPVTPTDPQGFAAAEMIRCDECLRANPPTRLGCLYCGAVLPLTETSDRLRKPTLRQPAKHEPAFNCILSVGRHGLLLTESRQEAANLLKLTVENVQEIIDAGCPLPLARTASREEAELVLNRLKDLGIPTLILSDQELGLREESAVRLRSLEFEEKNLVLHQAGGKQSVKVLWPELFLIVSGRLVVQQVEVKERMSRRSENEILDTSEFFADESVFDLYVSTHEQTWRIGANSFDFSCLQDQKSLIAGHNLKKLREIIAGKVTTLRVDDTYNEIKSVLDPVWPSEQETQSRGWRRERPGKYSIGAATINSNEAQFTRYSRLLRYFSFHSSN
jgi:hypothetical protein